MIARRLLWGLALLILVGAFAQTFLRNDPMYDLDILARASERLSAGESPYQLSLDRDEHTKAPLIHPLLAPLHRIPKPALYAG